MHELIMHFRVCGSEKMPLLPGVVNYKSSYSINLPLYWKLQTTVSCYTSTDHHHLLMHTISTSVSGVSNSARTSSFSAVFPQSPTYHSHTASGCLFALHKSPIISHSHHHHHFRTGPPHQIESEHHHRCTGTKRIFRIQLRYHRPILPFSSFSLSPSSKSRKFLSFAGHGVLVGGVRAATEGGARLMYRMSVF